MSGLLLPGAKPAAPTNTDIMLKEAHESRRSELVVLMQTILTAVEHKDVLDESEEGVATMVAHEADLVRPPAPSTRFNYYHLGLPRAIKMPDGRTRGDLVLVRIQVGRETVFGGYNGRYVPDGQPATCVMMRARPFVDEMLPSSLYNSPELDSRYTRLATVFNTMFGVEFPA